MQSLCIPSPSQERMEILRRGAEAEIRRGRWLGRDVIVKTRVPKEYRHEVSTGRFVPPVQGTKHG